jgi:hypothetical protein
MLDWWLTNLRIYAAITITNKFQSLDKLNDDKKTQKLGGKI